MNNNFNSFDISKEIVSKEAPTQSDNTLFEKAEQEDTEHRKQYDKRDVLYTALLSEYIDAYRRKTKRNRRLKLVFFWIAILSFGILILGAVASIILVSIFGGEQGNVIAIVVGNIVSIISSIVIIPKIIAEHLFPTNEEQNMNEMIKNMQENDAKIRLLFKNKQGNRE